jgi:hypothetical protein
MVLSTFCKFDLYWLLVITNIIRITDLLQMILEHTTCGLFIPAHVSALWWFVSRYLEHFSQPIELILQVLDKSCGVAYNGLLKWFYVRNVILFKFCFLPRIESLDWKYNLLFTMEINILSLWFVVLICTFCPGDKIYNAPFGCLHWEARHCIELNV